MAHPEIQQKNHQVPNLAQQQEAVTTRHQVALIHAASIHRLASCELGLLAPGPSASVPSELITSASSLPSSRASGDEGRRRIGAATRDCLAS
jgi:hypothetical protein